MTTFAFAHLTGVSINLKTKEIKLSATINLDDDNLELAQELEPFMGKDGSSVEISIAPRQMTLDDAKPSRAGRGDESQG